MRWPEGCGAFPTTNPATEGAKMSDAIKTDAAATEGCAAVIGSAVRKIRCSHCNKLTPIDQEGVWYEPEFSPGGLMEPFEEKITCRSCAESLVAWADEELAKEYPQSDCCETQHRRGTLNKRLAEMRAEFQELTKK
jgi:hypothetical protein